MQLSQCNMITIKLVLTFGKYSNTIDKMPCCFNAFQKSRNGHPAEGTGQKHLGTVIVFKIAKSYWLLNITGVGIGNIAQMLKPIFSLWISYKFLQIANILLEHNEYHQLALFILLNFEILNANPNYSYSCKYWSEIKILANPLASLPIRHQIGMHISPIMYPITSPIKVRILTEFCYLLIRWYSFLLL